MSRDLIRRVEKLEAGKGPTDGAMVRVFFEPRPCDDPEAFSRQCEAEAAGAQAIVVRFVASDFRRTTETLQ